MNESGVNTQRTINSRITHKSERNYLNEARSMEECNEKTNIYTTTKNGIKKIIYQAPWYKNRGYMGIVELSFEIPFDMKNMERD